VSDFVEADSPGRRAIGFGALLMVGLVAVGLISNEIDRASRTETIEGVRPVGALHLAGGALVFAEPDGRVVSYDIDQRQPTTLLDGLTQPIAADIGPDGTACAADRPAQPDGSAWLTCSSGLRIDLGSFEVSPLGEPLSDQGAWLTDIVSDGASGWIVADSGRTALLHVDGDGTVAIHTRFRQAIGFENVPFGLARNGDRVLVALGRAGITNLALADRNRESKGGSWVAGNESVGVATTEGFNSPLVLVHTDTDSSDFVTYPVPGDAIHPHLAEPLYRATGLTVLPDGRLAIAANGRLLLFRQQ
jgi:hypothetical protein